MSFRLTRLGRPVATVALSVLVGACAPVMDPAAIADAQTVARVKTALVNDPDLGGRAIEVRVVRAVVTLSGRVRTDEEARRAAELARAVSGVSDVQLNLQIGADPSQAADAPPGRESLLQESWEIQSNRDLFAIGAAFGWSNPYSPTMRSRLSVSPLIRIGSGSGLGPALAFGWFRADLQSVADRPDVVSRVHVKPVMVGASYTMRSERISVSPSLVAGVAFNSVTVTDTGLASGVPVEVSNSLAWRPAVSVWVELGRRLALNVSGGYVMTRLRITILDEGRLEKRDAKGDTTLVHAGLVYKLF